MFKKGQAIAQVLLFTVITSIITSSILTFLIDYSINIEHYLIQNSIL